MKFLSNKYTVSEWVVLLSFSDKSREDTVNLKNTFSDLKTIIILVIHIAIYMGSFCFSPC